MMRREKRVARLIRRSAVFAALALSAMGMAPRPGHAGAALMRAPATCAALGQYQVGPRVLPLAPPAIRPVPPHSHAPARLIAFSFLRGTLTLSSYSGCGGTTSGRFAIARAYGGPLPGPEPPRRPQRGAIACPEQGMYCGFVPTGIVAASGAFMQDPAHGTDPAYISVSAVITSAEPGPALGVPCSERYGCPAPSVITSTVAFTNVTGYLQVDADGASATLSVLPPPPGSTTTGGGGAESLLAPSPLILSGHKGTGTVPGAPSGNPGATAVAVTAVAGTAVAVPSTVVVSPPPPLPSPTVIR